MTAFLFLYHPAKICATGIEIDERCYKKDKFSRGTDHRSGKDWALGSVKDNRDTSTVLTSV